MSKVHLSGGSFEWCATDFAAHADESDPETVIVTVASGAMRLQTYVSAEECEALGRVFAEAAAKAFAERNWPRAMVAV